MTWAVKHGDGPTGMLDLPLSLAAMVCETAGCDWGDLNPSGQPGHLAAVLAGAMSFATGCSFDAALLIVAGWPLADALEHLEVDGGPL